MAVLTFRGQAIQYCEYVFLRSVRSAALVLILHAVDVWSIGCILAELILGKPLFKGKESVIFVY